MSAKPRLIEMLAAQISALAAQIAMRLAVISERLSSASVSVAHWTATTFHACVLAFPAWWRSWRNWRFNIYLGLLIELLLWLGAGTRFVTGAENWAIDAAMQASAAVHRDLAIQRPVTVIDIDEETWRSDQWGRGEPYRAPRKPLGTLIQYAIDKGARDIIVDIVVEAPSQDPEDSLFASDMARMAAQLKGTNRHILLTRTLREPLRAPDVLAPVWRTSPLDTAIRQSEDALVEVAPDFETARDGVVRKWRLWTEACEPPGANGGTSALGEWKVLLSPQLAVKARDMHDRGPGDRSGRFGVCLWRTSGLGAAAAVPDRREAEARIDADMQTWLTSHPELTGSKLEEEKPGSTHHYRFDPTSHILFTDSFPPSGTRVQVVSALKILEAGAQAIDAKPGEANPFHLPVILSDTIIIGQSAEGAHDMHMTPLGAMPGPMVIANALISLRHGVIGPFPEWLDFLIKLGLIVGIGWAFARWDSNVGTAVIAVLFVPVLLFSSYLLLQHGVWFDFSLPLVGIYAHRVTKGVEEYFELKRLLSEKSVSHVAHAEPQHANPQGEA